MWQTITHLRPYQQQAVRRAVEWSQQHKKKRFVLELPTGAGKTRIAIALTRRLLRAEQRAIFIADSIELVNQAHSAFLSFYDDEDIGLVWAQTKQFGRWITIASKDTLLASDNLEQLLLEQGGQPFSLMFIDECQGAPSDGYKKVVIPRLLTRENGTLIGLSATPYRADGINLRTVFPDDIAFSQDYFELVLQGYLANIESHDIETNLDLSSLVINAEEYTHQNDDEEKEKAFPPSLIKQLEESNRYEVAFTAWQQYAPEKRTLFFGHTLNDAYNFARYIESKGYECPVITGKTTKEDRIMNDVFIQGRDSILRRFKSGDLLFVANYEVLTTGVDIPQVECIILGRATNSRGLLIQIAGRGTRLCPDINKEKCVFLNLTDKHFILCSMGFLIGNYAASIPSLQQALKEKLDEEVEKSDDDEEKKGERSHYEVSIALDTIKTRAHNLFTGDGWTGDALTGKYTKPCGTYGQLEAERFFTGFAITHVYPSGLRRCLSQEALSIEHAMAIGQKKLLELQERERMQDGTSERLQLPITKGQLKHLSNQHVPLPPKDSTCRHMTQGHYMEIARHLKEYGGAFTKEGGCIGFLHNTWTGEWEVRRWPYHHTQSKVSMKKKNRRKQQQQQPPSPNTTTRNNDDHHHHTHQSETIVQSA